MTEQLGFTHRPGRLAVGLAVLSCSFVCVGAVTAAQAPNGLIILLNVSNDGRTLTLTPVQPGTLTVPPALPAGQFPGLPPAPPKPSAAPPGPAVTAVGMVDVFTFLNVRSGPGTNFPILGSLGPGAKIQIVSQSNGWDQIVWQGRLAWVCAYYIWTPGKALRNAALRGQATGGFGPAAVPPAQGLPPSVPPPPAPAGVPAGRASDGGLAVPVLNQNTIGAQSPGGFCGPTSLKMVLGYYGQNRDINFLGLAKVGGATPVYTKGVGAGWQAMLDMLQYCGLKGSTMSSGQSLAWLRQQTASGTPVVVGVRGNYGAGWVTQGHILVVAGVTSDGNVIICDSAGGHRRTVNGSMFYNAWSGANRMAIVARP